MDARERIQEVIRAATAKGVEWAKYGGAYPDFDEHTDRIVALVREAMLSEEAVKEAYEEGWTGGEAWEDVHPVKQDNFKSQFTVALDTAFGEEPPSSRQEEER